MNRFIKKKIRIFPRCSYNKMRPYTRQMFQMKYSMSVVLLQQIFSSCTVPGIIPQTL